MSLLAALAALIWVYLLVGHGWFWRSGPTLPPAPQPPPVAAPSVCVVVPARDEAAQIAPVLRALCAQDYPGRLQIILVDDQSGDGTGAIAAGLTLPRLRVLSGTPCPPGWSGKLWAVAQGVAAAPADTDYLLLTDADILHAPGHLAALVGLAEADRRDMVSEMVALHCDSLAERALVPAFVFFFQLLYPFARVADPRSATAAAAGGTILVRRDALARSGGIGAIRAALIDDVAMAKAVKRDGGRLWLGHADQARSLRVYPGFGDIWRMITRTAYVQLRHSPWLLAATLAGMALVWLLPPLAAILGHGALRLLGAFGWAAASLAYLPTLRRYRRALLWAPLLPAIAGFYMAATLAAAWNHHRGQGVSWRGRAYPGAA